MNDQVGLLRHAVRASGLVTVIQGRFGEVFVGDVAGEVGFTADGDTALSTLVLLGLGSGLGLGARSGVVVDICVSG